MVNAIFPKQEAQKLGARLSPDRVFDLVLAEKKIVPAEDDLIVADMDVSKPETEAFQGGQPVVESVPEVPKVTVAPAAVETPAAEEEAEARVPEDVAEAEKQVVDVVEAVSEVAAEERAEAAEIQEPATDTVPPSSAQDHDTFIKKPEDTDTEEAADLEQVIAYNPRNGEMVEQ